MQIGEVLLGLAGIALGYKSLSTGVERLHTGLRGGGTPDGGSARPTVRVPRAATMNMPPVVQAGARKNTLAGQMRVTTREVRTLGDRLSIIIDLAHKAKLDPQIIAWARKELSKKCGPGWNGQQWCVPEKDTEAEIMAIFKAMRRDVRYTSDVRGVDTYASPRKALELGAEDCDGYAALGCGALMAVGIPCRLEVIQTTKSSTPDHIFIQGGTPKASVEKWISLDASVPMPPGWRAPDSMISRRWIFETE
jgi:hypothetical protein